MSPLERWATFDCYGTLIDWERGIADTFATLWPGTDRDALLETYHEVEPLVQQGSGMPYAEVLARTLRGVAERHGLEVSAPDALSTSLPRWPPFPEVPSALTELRERGWKLGVLSNTDPELLAASVANIGVDVDLRITVADSGSYKPAHGHWDTFFARTDADRAGHVHVAASLFHDIAPAAELGLRAVWVNRKHETTQLPLAAEITDLGPLPDVLDGLMAG